MEKTGSQFDKVVAISSLIDVAEESYQSTPAFKDYTNFGAELLSQLKITEKSKDPKQIIGLEKLLVGLEIQEYQENSPERLASLKAAYIDLGIIQKGLNFVEKCENYTEIDQLYHPKNKKRGVPMDETHTALKAHVTRLGNDMRGYTNIPEKNRLRQRQKNIRLTRELYIELQQKALGIEPEQKSKDIER